MAPRSGMQVQTHGVFLVKAKNFLTDLGSLELSYRAKGTEEMCRGGSAFPCKGTPRSTFPGGWDRKFAGCREREPSSGKKRQPPGVCLQASLEDTVLLIQLNSSSAQRTEVSEAGPCISPSLCNPCKDIPS